MEQSDKLEVISFRSMLQDNQFVKDFHNFLKLEFGEENLSFFLEVEDYKTSLDVEKAKHIIEKYIKARADKEINISFKTKCAVARRIETGLHFKIPGYDSAIYNPPPPDSRERKASIVRDSRADSNPSRRKSSGSGSESAPFSGSNGPAINNMGELFHEAQEEIYQLLFLGPFQRFKAFDASTLHHDMDPESIYGLCYSYHEWVQLSKKRGLEVQRYTNLQKNLFFLKGSVLIRSSPTSIYEYMLGVENQREYDATVTSAVIRDSRDGVEYLQIQFKEGHKVGMERTLHKVEDSHVIALKESATHELHKFVIISPCTDKSTYLHYLFEFDLSADEWAYEEKGKDVSEMLSVIKKKVIKRNSSSLGSFFSGLCAPSPPAAAQLSVSVVAS